ncbi:MAG: TRAP transporter small permease subunit [Gammaproteobacteria bacterium]|nr:TRAP transporter small permease subunit [Gammaproteobacteria bacterium]NNC98269.1 TRAP transporter small permease subunit [Gammaproteobacteria bacterium]NNM14916.1 TRAP transporter small permease subunit [Gammaproteobacteria bacterium]
MQKLAKQISTLCDCLGRTVSWLTLFMVLVTFAIVVLRKFFDLGWIWLQESVTWMHALVFMLAAAYTLNADEHVRVDIFYTRCSPRTKAYVDLVGAIVLLLPLCAFIAWSSWDYVSESWRIRETSWQSGGLPALYLLKAVIPLTAILLGLLGFLRSLANFIEVKQRS